MERVSVSGVTIDDIRSRDLDDAVWAEPIDGGGWRVQVTIADVSSAVPVGSEMDQRAYQWVVTKYYASGTSPMLPPRLSEDALSLLPDAPRDTLTVEFVLGPDLARRSTRIFQSRFQSAGRLTYLEIPGIIADEMHKHHTLVRLLGKLSYGLLDARRNAGALVLYDLNNGWATTEEGYLKEISNTKATVGYIIVQELMIAANSAVAAYTVEHDLPVPFRNHVARAAAPDRQELMQQISDAMQAPTDVRVIRERVHMLLSKASYDAVLLGHYGLSVPAYLHFTSPIRRFADLVVHRQISAHLRGEPLPYSYEDVRGLATHINTVIEAERQSTADFMKARAENKVRSALDDARRLDSLDAKGFERAVKVAARAGEDCPQGLRDAYVKRLGENRAPVTAILSVLLEAPRTGLWADLRATTFEVLKSRPSDAAAAVNIAMQLAGAPPIQYETHSDGEPHERVFTSTARLPNGTQSAIYMGQSIRQSQQRAALGILASLADLPPPAYQPSEPIARPSRGKKKIKLPSPDQDAISALQEWTQANDLPTPTYTFDVSGPSHVPVFTCRCTVRQISAEGSAANKQDAKRNAAAAVIRALHQDNGSVAQAT